MPLGMLDQSTRKLANKVDLAVTIEVTDGLLNHILFAENSKSAENFCRTIFNLILQEQFKPLPHDKSSLSFKSMIEMLGRFVDKQDYQPDPAYNYDSFEILPSREDNYDVEKSAQLQRQFDDVVKEAKRMVQDGEAKDYLIFANFDDHVMALSDNEDRNLMLLEKYFQFGCEKYKLDQKEVLKLFIKNVLKLQAVLLGKEIPGADNSVASKIRFYKISDGYNFDFDRSLAEWQKCKLVEKAMLKLLNYRFNWYSFFVSTGRTTYLLTCKSTHAGFWGEIQEQMKSICHDLGSFEGQDEPSKIQEAVLYKYKDFFPALEVKTDFLHGFNKIKVFSDKAKELNYRPTKDCSSFEIKDLIDLGADKKIAALNLWYRYGSQSNHIESVINDEQELLILLAEMLTRQIMVYPELSNKLIYFPETFQSIKNKEIKAKKFQN